MKPKIICIALLTFVFSEVRSQIPNLHVEGNNTILTIEALIDNAKLQFTDNFVATTDDWIIVFDKNDNGQLKWRFDNVSLMTLTDDGLLGIGTTVPEVPLHLKGGSDANLSAGSGFIQFGNTTGLNLIIDNNEIQVRNNGVADNLGLNLDGGEVHFGRDATNTDIKLRGTFEATSLEGSGTRNVVANADGQLMASSYEIGDLAHGGIVFWVDETGQHGLVAALSDQTSNIRWYAGTIGPGLLTRATGTGIYAGEMNTAVIIAAFVAIGDDGNNYAAQICLNAVISGYGDWYLPSKEELDLMYFNLHLATPSLGSFVPGPYWSSTEATFAEALYRSFNDGTHGPRNKSDNTLAVRAIRRF